MHVWTDTPVAEVWQQLRYFKPAANVRNLLTGQTASSRTERWPVDESIARAHEIASCVEQADEYFQASRTVGLATKPLLQFYGAEALAKAMILAGDRTVNLQDLRYHGLSTRASTAAGPGRDDLQRYADSPLAWAVEQEFAVTNHGVFVQLARVTGDAPVGPGTVIRFREVLRIMPDLAQAYERHYGEPSHCVMLYDRPRSQPGEPFTIRFTAANVEAVTIVFPEFTEGFEEHRLHEQPGFRALSADSPPPTFGRIVRHSVAGEYFVRPHPCGIFNSTAVLFAASFIISNLVRYKPAFWMRVLQGADTGAAAFVEMVCNVIDRRFAQDVLESIWNERFTFGSPGYLA
jgi:hypothetical protein